MKRTASQIKQSKRQKNSAQGLQKSEDEIVGMCTQIVSSPQHYNNLVVLLDWLEEAVEKAWKSQTALLLQNLVKTFGRLAKNGAFRRSEGDAQNEISTWLQDRLDEFAIKITAIPENTKFTTDIISLYAAVLLKILKVYTTKEGDGYYSKRVFSSFVQSLILSSHDDIDVAFAELTPLLNEYDDLRFYFYVEVAAVLENNLSSKQSKRASKNLIATLLSISTFPKSNDDLTSFYLGEPDQLSKSSLKHGSPFKYSSHQVAFQKCWLRVLRLPQTAQQYKSVLAVLHQRVIPNMITPQLLMDYLTDSYNAGGAAALLALNGLFSLMQTYNLDYPDFYTKLYALFDSSILYVKYRARFFRLVDLFLSSTHLPAAIVASFIKRISRLALYAPPAAIVACIPFIYNQLKRHPACMVMIHNPEGDIVTCPFDNNEPNPLKTNALDSSLWELETLQSHYHPSVASLARIMSQPFTKPQYILEDFLDHSYKDLLESEHKRKLRNVPALEFDTFAHTLEVGGAEGSIYLKGWSL